MHSTSPKRIPRLAQLRMKIAPSGPVSNSSVCRTFSACDTSLRPKPKLAHSSASPEMTFAPASTTLENSDTANKVLLTYVSLTSSVITSATSESMGLRAGAGLLAAATSGGFQCGPRLYWGLRCATTAGTARGNPRSGTLAPRSGERVARALSAVTRVFDALWRGPGEAGSRESDGGNCSAPRRVRVGRAGLGFRVRSVRHRRRHRANSDFRLFVAAVRRRASRVDARGGRNLDGAGSAERGGIDPQAARTRQSGPAVL